MNIPPFDFSSLTPHQLVIIKEAITQTSFNFAALIPGLEAQVRRNYIPVLFSDLSRYSVMEGSTEAIIGHGHEGHSHTEGVGAHVIERVVNNRKMVLGLAWYSGKVEVEISLESNPQLAMEVFLAEGAHMVDFFFMTPEHRERIFAIYHGGSTEVHDHGWFEETGNNDYWSWIGESFMYGFIAAFSLIPGTGDSFIHRTTPEVGAAIRDILAPPMKVARHKKSSIAHRMGSWHERQVSPANQENYLNLEAAYAAGLRKCKTCRWNGL